MYSKFKTSNYEYIKNNSLLEGYIKDISLGSKEAFINLYEITKNSVYGFALSILKNSHDAEDVMQEVYIKICENASAYQTHGKALAWIITITKNLSLMKIRKNKNHIDIDSILESIPGYMSDNETKLLLDAAFKVITDEERNILVLHAVSGFKHREIAKLLNLPISTVLSKYNRTIKKIKKFISEEA